MKWSSVSRRSGRTRVIAHHRAHMTTLSSVLRFAVLPWTQRTTSAAKCYNQSDMSDESYYFFRVDKSAEITVNWSMGLGSVSS
jgi:hypothetical protein